MRLVEDRFLFDPDQLKRGGFKYVAPVGYDFGVEWVTPEYGIRCFGWVSNFKRGNPSVRIGFSNKLATMTTLYDGKLRKLLSDTRDVMEYFSEVGNYMDYFAHQVDKLRKGDIEYLMNADSFVDSLKSYQRDFNMSVAGIR